MTKKRASWADPATIGGDDVLEGESVSAKSLGGDEEAPRAGESMGFTLSGLLTVDLQRHTIRLPSAASVAIANHPDNRIDFDMTGGTMTIPPGWLVKTF